jgi:hypothetical protein
MEEIVKSNIHSKCLSSLVFEGHSVFRMLICFIGRVLIGIFVLVYLCYIVIVEYYSTLSSQAIDRLHSVGRELNL